MILFELVSVFVPPWVQFLKCQTVKNWIFRIRVPKFSVKFWFFLSRFHYFVPFWVRISKCETIKNGIFEIREPKFWSNPARFQYSVCGPQVDIRLSLRPSSHDQTQSAALKSWSDSVCGLTVAFFMITVSQGNFDSILSFSVFVSPWF